jgi:hypothetical protein
MNRRRIALAAAGGAAVSVLVAAAAQAHQVSPTMHARDDAFRVGSGHT